MQPTLVPVEQYLSGDYQPDADYVDGIIEERNVGEKEHGKLQLRVAMLLKKSRILVPFIETRVQISATRFRVPDICAYHREPDESIFTAPPALCVEILSPEDRMSRTMRVVNDYVSLGVAMVWILDPWERKAYTADGMGLREVTGSVSAEEGRVVLAFSQIFSDEDLF